ncbi:hypothetical protein [Paenibacillus harenae]|uniref:hypothetical protein n=1 Tax=Paenibacillus harenae TaxID=306543 RepID=UPI0027940717|nr:hypothetical protein [Paenibacillus harenae]MDQ0058897.1 hypothetical protein [Paenibacillus harenae]
MTVVTSLRKLFIKRLFGSGHDEEASLIAGLQAGYLFIGACALLCSIVSFILYRMLTKRNEIL